MYKKLLTKKVPYLIVLLRLSLGWIFLWPFLDKLFGLGFATSSGNAWLKGASPTTGFLKFGTQGPFAEIFQSLAGNIFIDWLFMLGLLGIGVAFMLGIGMRIAAYSGALMLVLMYMALLWPEHNLFLDDHLIYALALLALYKLNAGNYLGLGKWWGNLAIVKKFPILR